MHFADSFKINQLEKPGVGCKEYYHKKVVTLSVSDSLPSISTYSKMNIEHPTSNIENNRFRFSVLGFKYGSLLSAESYSKQNT